MEMSSTITRERGRSRFDHRRRARRGGESDLRRPGAGRRTGTLEDLVTATMDRIAEAGTASCPVCAEPTLAAGGCRTCGAHLS